ncbi:YheC/YheD family protein [Paenibacillus doosanensis]|uniref:Endospore coat-associated protein YheD n=1 Tax=Paenibacillus konkukensis TaxID=2020716 RepID=A0ABY4RMS2_9BACL|nr:MULTISPECIES: YheC/YheD family protein [Paenibacillus]MCS7463630.1 YheC/YheD family protein [Paenibacillus doosanensis]UQZ83156.1 Endospore coat-associated protein YheD [Paenibacillus konkukensis]
MKRTKVKIVVPSAGKSSSLDGRTIMLSDALLKRWKISTQTPLTLRFGSAKHEVTVASTSQTGVLRINDSIAAEWGLSHGDSLCLQYKASTRTLHIGPLIGVMISRVYPGNVDRPFGAITAFCRELTDACKLYGASVYFVTPDDLNGQSDTVRGWHYAGKWEKQPFPVPHVIYNRLTSRKLENRANVQQFIRHAKTQYQSVLFNEKYLNKTEVFDALNKENGLHTYLPESHLLQNFQMLKTMCAKYPVVFLKPITGSLGKGIIRITRQADQTYVCHFTNLSSTRKQSFAKLSQLFAAISRKIKQRRYQIQQGLSLIAVGGRPVDFRALVQRNEAGQWGITSIVARIAGNHHFVSNLARGGSLSSVKEALARSSSTAASGGAIKLRRAALAIAKGVEAQIPAHFAELGIDLALDTQGRVWLLEVNSKPSKDDNTPLSTDRKIRPSVRRIVQYSRFAAKF